MVLKFTDEFRDILRKDLADDEIEYWEGAIASIREEEKIIAGARVDRYWLEPGW